MRRFHVEGMQEGAAARCHSGADERAGVQEPVPELGPVTATGLGGVLLGVAPSTAAWCGLALVALGRWLAHQ